MRKMMTKEVTFTTIKAVSVEAFDGKPVTTPLDDVIVLGQITKEKAQKMFSEGMDNVMVWDVQTDTKIYEMAVEDFIKYASIKGEDSPDEEETEEEVEEIKTSKNIKIKK